MTDTLSVSLSDVDADAQGLLLRMVRFAAGTIYAVTYEGGTFTVTASVPNKRYLADLKGNLSALAADLGRESISFAIGTTSFVVERLTYAR